MFFEHFFSWSALSCSAWLSLSPFILVVWASSAAYCYSLASFSRFLFSSFHFFIKSSLSSSSWASQLYLIAFSTSLVFLPHITFKLVVRSEIASIWLALTLDSASITACSYLVCISMMSAFFSAKNLVLSIFKRFFLSAVALVFMALTSSSL